MHKWILQMISIILLMMIQNIVLKCSKFHYSSDDYYFFSQMIYSGYSCSQGWFCTPCISDPGFRLILILSSIIFFDFMSFAFQFVISNYLLSYYCRGLKNIMHLSIKKDSNCSEWENIPIPKR